MNGRVFAFVVSVCVGAMALGGGTAIGAPQPEPRGERAQRPVPPHGQEGGGGRRVLREMIERRIEFTRRQMERLERALRMLDDGADPAEVEAEFPDIGRGPGGPGGSGGGPGGMIDGEPFDGPPGQRGQGRGPRDGGAGGEGGMGRREPPPDRPLTDEERAAVREFLRTAQPRLHEMFTELEKADPDEAARRMREMFPRFRPMIELRQNDPALFELRMRELRTGREAMEAARRLIEIERDAGAPEADRARAEEAFRGAVVAHLDARADIGRHELNRQIENARRELAELDRRASERESEVLRFMQRMIERERQRARDGDKPQGPEDREPMRGRGGRRGDQRP